MLSSVILDMPSPFRVKGKLLHLYPLTLAKVLLMEPYLSSLGIDNGLLLTNPMMEAVRLVESSRESCTAILAISTCPNTRRDLHDWKEMEQRKKVLARLSDGDMATLLVLALTSDKTDVLIHGLGLDAERERMSRVMAVKSGDADGSHTLAFGGRSLFGTFIGRLKEMGYDDDEIIFRRGYSYLRLMLADKVSTIHLTKEERNRLGTADGGTVMDGNDPGAIAELEQWLKKKGMKIRTEGASVRTRPDEDDEKHKDNRLTTIKN